jgi:hypothetical protein
MAGKIFCFNNMSLMYKCLLFNTLIYMWLFKWNQVSGFFFLGLGSESYKIQTILDRTDVILSSQSRSGSNVSRMQSVA